MKKLLSLFFGVVLFTGIAWGSGIENPLGPVDPGNSHNGYTWTMILRGHEYIVDGDLNRFLKVPREYVFKVRVADMNGWIYFDSDICLHSWQLFAGDVSQTKFLWYGWMNGGFRTTDERGFVSGRVEFVAGGGPDGRGFPLSFCGGIFQAEQKWRGDRNQGHSDLPGHDWPLAELLGGGLQPDHEKGLG